MKSLILILSLSTATLIAIESATQSTQQYGSEVHYTTPNQGPGNYGAGNQGINPQYDNYDRSAGSSYPGDYQGGYPSSKMQNYYVIPPASDSTQPRTKSDPYHPSMQNPSAARVGNPNSGTTGTGGSSTTHTTSGYTQGGRR